MTEYNDITEADIAEALSYVDAGCRETWLRMAMAVKSELGDAGHAMWDDWSRSDASYNERDARDVWRSVRPTGGVTIATLMQQARQGGYKESPERARLSATDQQARREAREREAAEQAKLDNERAAKAATAANEMFNAASPTNVAAHPYVERKQLGATGRARIGTYTRWHNGGCISISNALLIPMVAEDKTLTSLQAIFPDDQNPLERDRDYLPSGRKQGAYTNIGKPTGAQDERIVICEGFATGCTIHDATGYPVLVAFDAGNLTEVANIARRKLPNATIIIAADNDAYHDDGKNPGVTQGRKAASACNGVLAVPRFSDKASKPTDFNDLMQLHGLQTVREQINQAAERTLQPAPEGALSAADIATDAANAPLIFCNSKGKPKNCIENFQEMLHRINVHIRYNVISKEIEILIPGQSFSIDNKGNASLAWLASCCAHFDMSTDKIGDYVTYIADQNQYNPAAAWITSKPWDGQDRLRDLCGTITAVGEADDMRVLDLKETLIRRWMLTGIAAAFSPTGVSSAGVLVLQGDQYLGKTKWFKSLVPNELELIQDGMLLRPDDKDSVKQVCSFWLVELGELDATFRKADIAALKSFITRDRDVIRRAYARVESHYARRTVFFASVNPKQFLHDSTGNRRYWTIECESINHSHSIDMQQVWAQVYALWKQGESIYLTAAEMAALNAHNEGFSVVDPIEERIQAALDWDAPKHMWRWETATHLLIELGMDKANHSEVTRASMILRKLNGGAGKRSNGRNLLLIPMKKTIQTAF